MPSTGAARQRLRIDDSAARPAHRQGATANHLHTHSPTASVGTVELLLSISGDPLWSKVIWPLLISVMNAVNDLCVVDPARATLKLVDRRVQTKSGSIRSSRSH